MKGLKQLHNNCYALRLLILFPLQTYRKINTGEKHPGKENAKKIVSSYGLCFFNKICQVCTMRYLIFQEPF